MKTGDVYPSVRFLYGSPGRYGFEYYAYDDYHLDEVDAHEKDLERWGITYKKLTVSSEYPIDN